MVECLKITTATESQRIAKFAFDYATKNGRKKVTAVHKANIMKLGDGLFLKSCTEVDTLYTPILLLVNLVLVINMKGFINDLMVGTPFSYSHELKLKLGIPDKQLRTRFPVKPFLS